MLQKEYSRQEALYAIKFVTKKLKFLMTDEYGRKAYVGSFNQVFEDIFGVKKFGSALVHAYDDREVIAIYNRFNFEVLFGVCNTPKFYNGISDLIRMNERIEELEARIKKAQKKEKKPDKGDLKERRYLIELYKDTVKEIRRTLNLKKSNSYKTRYSSAKNLVDSRRRGYFFDDDDDDDESVIFVDNDRYDEPDESEFERYFKKASGIVPRKSVERRRPSIMDEDDDDDELEEDDTDETDSEDLQTSDVDKKLDIMSRNINMLTSAVQVLVNTQSDINQSETYVANKLATRISPETIEDSDISRNEFNQLVELCGTLSSTQDRIIDNLNETTEFVKRFVAYVSEPDDEVVETSNDAPKTVEELLNEVEVQHTQPDGTIVEQASTDTDDSEKSADELIEKVNGKPINMEAKKKPPLKKTPQKQPPHDDSALSDA